MEPDFLTLQLYELYLQFPSVVTDSRKIIENCLFFALKGENFDGNNFAGKALESGAAYAVVDNPSVVKSDRFILVGDVLHSLQQLAAYHRKQLRIPILAITGTNGKTTTKELVSTVIARKLATEYTRGNLNNHIGVPLTLLSMTQDTEIGVVEMGANHPGEIDFLCRIADPDYGLVTNMGKAHLEGFGGFEGVVRTKSELYRYLERRKGTIFINCDNPLLNRSAGDILEKITYGTRQECQISGETIDSSPFLHINITIKNETFPVLTRLVGAYNFENVLAAVAVGYRFGISSEEIKNAIESYTPSNSRSQWINTASNTIIMDAYNANPTSMQASITSFLKMESPRKLLILGDMLELGDESASEHQQIVDLLASHHDCSVYLVGKWFKATVKPDYFLTFDCAEYLAGFLHDNPVHDTLILIKGSRGIQLEKILPVFS